MEVLFIVSGPCLSQYLSASQKAKILQELLQFDVTFLNIWKWHRTLCLVCRDLFTSAQQAVWINAQTPPCCRVSILSTRQFCPAIRAKEKFSCCKAKVASAVRLSVASTVADRFLRLLSSSFRTSLGINVLIKCLHPESWGVPHTVGEEVKGQIHIWVRGCINPPPPAAGMTPGRGTVKQTSKL